MYANIMFCIFKTLATSDVVYSSSDAPIIELADFLINRYLMADNS